MLKISNFEVMGWEHAIRGMRNPMNSWAKSDSEVSICECEHWPHDVKKVVCPSRLQRPRFNEAPP